MLWVPQKGRLRYESNTGAGAASVLGTAVQTGASSATKGTAVELIASTSFDAYWVRITAMEHGATNTASQSALDILIGSAPGAVIIPNLLVGGAGSAFATGKSAKVWDFNLYIPSGSRLSAQAAGVRTNVNMRVGIYLYGGDGYPHYRVGSKVTTYGMGTVPNGTAITPGSSGAVGTFTQITAATTDNHFAFVPSFQTAVSTVTTQLLTVEIGAGAATEEVISFPYWFGTDSGEFMDGPYNSMPTFQDIPSGTRLAMRASASGTPDTYNGVIHALS